ncbi:MAG TPA: NAD(P)/FAD-dependent oxidoreductase [Thermoleophilaceae bacterium]|nr:NAD(P)/FAD-dependent oxidoreductase [Thermoleophilaceae bacterium]
MERIDTVVIGAGPAGLASAAMLRRRGVPCVVLERDAIAASWRRHYDRLHLHTARGFSHLPGLRMSSRHGRWVPRDGVIGYLERYARHHGIEVRRGIEVSRLDREDGGWRIETSEGAVHARALVVATGYNREPHMPEWPGREGFTGDLIHGSEYRNPDPYRGRDVLVVGSGNTGAEIAVDLVEGGASRVRLAVRTPPNILPRETGGVPAQATGILMRHLPAKVADPIVEATRRVTVGDLSPYGMPPAPRGAFSQAVEDDVVPILDVGLIGALKRGEVEVVPAVEGFDGAEVLLRGGERVSPGAVIACAGYRRALEPLIGHLGLVGDKGRPVVHGARTDPRAPDLHFIGYTNPISGMFREFGIDARRIAKHQARRRSAV